MSTEQHNSTTAFLAHNTSTALPASSPTTQSTVMTSTTTTTASVTSSYAQNSSLTSSLGPASNSTAAASTGGSGTPKAAETVIIIIIALSIIVIVLTTVFFLLKKFGRLPPFCNRSLRKRRSSTCSSRRALDEESMADNSSIHRPNEKLKQTTEEMFTIDDFEEDAGDRDREEYYYDEVFGQSEFEDETTKNSVRQLYTSTEDNDEMLDFDFETLGIRADGFSRNAAGGGVSV